MVRLLSLTVVFVLALTGIASAKGSGSSSSRSYSAPKPSYSAPKPAPRPITTPRPTTPLRPTIRPTTRPRLVRPGARRVPVAGIPVASRQNCKSGVKGPLVAVIAIVCLLIGGALGYVFSRR